MKEREVALDSVPATKGPTVRKGGEFSRSTCNEGRHVVTTLLDALIATTPCNPEQAEQVTGGDAGPCMASRYRLHLERP